jgi:hypothetical protein
MLGVQVTGKAEKPSTDIAQTQHPEVSAPATGEAKKLKADMNSSWAPEQWAFDLGIPVTGEAEKPKNDMDNLMMSEQEPPPSPSRIICLSRDVCLDLDPPVVDVAARRKITPAPYELSEDHTSVPDSTSSHVDFSWLTRGRKFPASISNVQVSKERSNESSEHDRAQPKGSVCSRQAAEPKPQLKIPRKRPVGNDDDWNEDPKVQSKGHISTVQGVAPSKERWASQPVDIHHSLASGQMLSKDLSFPRTFSCFASFC